MEVFITQAQVWSFPLIIYSTLIFQTEFLSHLCIFYNIYKNVGRRQWHPTQYSCLENPMDGGACWTAVQGVVKSRTRLRDLPFTFHFHALEKEMATHFSVLAWRIPGMAEPGGLPSMGSHWVKHDWSNLAAAGKAKRMSSQKTWKRGFPGGPLAKTLLPAQEAWVQSLFRELGPPGHN